MEDQGSAQVAECICHSHSNPRSFNLDESPLSVKGFRRVHSYFPASRSRQGWRVFSFEGQRKDLRRLLGLWGGPRFATKRGRKYTSFDPSNGKQRRLSIMQNPGWNAGLRGRMEMFKLGPDARLLSRFVLCKPIICCMQICSLSGTRGGEQGCNMVALLLEANR